jgi:hypothetical protein
MEGDVAARWGGALTADRGYHRSGQQAGRWTGLGTSAAAVTVGPADWRRFDLLAFWCRASRARGLKFEVQVESQGRPAVSRPVSVDWEGWQEVRLPLADFGEADWQHVTALRMRAVGSPPADAALWFDDLRLVIVPPDPNRPRPEGLLCDFEADDLELWGGGLAPDTEHFTSGKQSGLWTDPPRNDNRTLEPPIKDWTPYQYVEFDVYSRAANEAEFIFTVFSDNPDTDGPDYWSTIVKVNWEGWKHFKIPFRRMFEMRRPVGWDRVSAVRLYGMGWGMPEVPDTVLSFDALRLSKGPGHKLEEGVLDDFEEGPYAWWGGMDEGPVPAKQGQQCGQLRRTATHTGMNPPVSDWRPYKKVTAWVYAAGLGGVHCVAWLNCSAFHSAPPPAPPPPPPPAPPPAPGVPAPPAAAPAPPALPPPDQWPGFVGLVEGEWRRAEWWFPAGTDPAALANVKRLMVGVTAFNGQVPTEAITCVDDLRLER